MTSVGTTQNTSAKPGSVLIVDDNPLIAMVLRSLLQNDGLQVSVATNGEEALAALKDEVVDVIVCDVMMPRMDGYEFHERVRENPDYSHIPFIFLTALSDDREKNRGLMTGADVYLTKPFDPSAMVPLVMGKVTRARGLKKAAEHGFTTYRKKVVNTLSHEFRTPLVAITTGSELLLDHADNFDSSKVQQLVQAIQRGGARLERLVNDFMLLQQLDLGVGAKMYQSRGGVAELKPVIERVLEERFPELANQGFACKADLNVEGLSFFFYVAQVEDLLRRLVENAAKFSRQTKEVSVSVQRRGDEVVITVLDRGVGVDPNRSALSLELFGQVDREKLEQQGTGMGLAVVQRYLEIMGGSFTLSAREGGGAAAQVVLPLRKAP